jgi:hypothetical protein
MKRLHKFFDLTQMRLGISLHRAFADGGVNDGTPSC